MSTLITIQLTVTILFFFVVCAVLLIYTTIFWSLFRDAPFVPSPKSVGKAMMDLADVKPGERVVDLGSGHGALLFAAAERGAKGTGYELSRLLGFFTKLCRFFLHPKAKVEVRRKDLFSADLRDADVVACYLFSGVMKKLRCKFEAELKPGARVVSASFIIPGWTPQKTISIANRPIYLYEIGKV